jgi:hypothetical protein
LCICIAVIARPSIQRRAPTHSNENAHPSKQRKLFAKGTESQPLVVEDTQPSSPLVARTLRQKPVGNMTPYVLLRIEGCAAGHNRGSIRASNACFCYLMLFFLASRTANNTMYINSRYLPNQVIETAICNSTTINHLIFGLQLNQLNHDSKKLRSTQSTASKLIEFIVDNSAQGMYHSRFHVE